MCLAIPGQVLDLRGDDPLFRSGRVSFGGVIKEISFTCAPEAKVGDYVLVHVGVAISVIDEAEAAETFRYLREMGELADLAPAAPDAAPPASPGGPS